MTRKPRGKPADFLDNLTLFLIFDIYRCHKARNGDCRTGGYDEQTVRANHIDFTRIDNGKYEMEASISRQKAALAKYAQEHSMTNIRIYSDCGFSAHGEMRPAFAKLETGKHSGKVSALVLFDLTRLSRDYIVTSEWIEAFLPRHHAGLYSIKAQITPNRPISLALPVAALFGGGR